MVHLAESLNINRILEYSRFDDPGKQTGITTDRFKSYDDIIMIGD